MKYYITVKQNPKYKQMTLEELLFGDLSNYKAVSDYCETNTRTYTTHAISEKLKPAQKRAELYEKLKNFNEMYAALREAPRHSLYYEFKIPKKSGGWRSICAPNKELMAALRLLKGIFEDDFNALYHTSAFAYVRGRSCVDAMKRHQNNDSKWYMKLDMHNFFGDTTKEFVLKMFKEIYPFCLLMTTPEGCDEMEKAIDLCCLDGVLPQGTPVSPLITNIMMIPFDHYMANTLHEFNKQTFVYTRYADDLTISSKYNFNYKEIQKLVVDELMVLGAPFHLNEKKTRYGSRNGKNWNLGVMINKDNQMTIGHEEKRRYKAAITNYLLDSRNGKQWNKSDVQVLAGKRNYYKQIEPECIHEIDVKLSQKFRIWLPAQLKHDLKRV